MLKSNVLRFPVFAAAVSVNVAGITFPGDRVVPSLSHVKVKHAFAEIGFHSDAVMLSVSFVFPVFLM
jgi:hypothetical protein